jgi:hypothetical protein
LGFRGRDEIKKRVGGKKEKREGMVVFMARPCGEGE